MKTTVFQDEAYGHVSGKTGGQHAKKLASCSWSLHSWIKYICDSSGAGYGKASQWLPRTGSGGSGVPRVFQALEEGHVYYPEDRFIGLSVTETDDECGEC